MQIKDLKQDKRNYRKHNERNLGLIKKSVDEVGLGRSIVIDSENEIVCGNGLVSQLDEKTPVKVIETDGSELVVVKRTDLKTEDEKRKKLAIMDKLNALGVIVVCEGVHFCMRSRGVKKQDASMVTSAVRGIFADDYKARQEFLSLIKD